ncbi:MAG: DUF3712 domain-containing protein, partial [Thermoplasmata archaeon]|nr:DUF3712 domain-containing protein [Thermoplasmata archaeon]
MNEQEADTHSPDKVDTKDNAHLSEDSRAKDNEPIGEDSKSEGNENAETTDSSDTSRPTGTLKGLEPKPTEPAPLPESRSTGTPDTTEPKSTETPPPSDGDSKQRPPGAPTPSRPKPHLKIRTSRKRMLMAGVLVVILLLGGFKGVNLYAQSVIDSTDIEIIGIRVTGSGKDYLEVVVDAEVDNPSSRSGSYQDLELDVLYRGKKMGKIKVPSQNIESGKNELAIKSRLFSVSDTVFDSFVRALLDRDEVEIDIKGDIHIGGTLHTSNRLKKTLTIQGFAGLSIEVPRITLENMDNEGIALQAEAKVYNPSSIAINLSESSFDLFCNQSFCNQTRLASFSLSGQSFRPGNNTLRVNLFIPASHEAHYNSLASDIITGRSPEFLIKGNSSGDLLLSRLLQNFQHGYIMNLTSPVEASATSMRLVSQSRDSVVFEIMADVENPSPISLNLTDFEFQAVYKGANIGEIYFLTPTALVPGNNTLVLRMEIDSYTSEAARLFSRYLQGETVELKVKGEHVFSSERLEFALPILLSGSGALSLTIDQLEVVDSNETTIWTNLALSIRGPLQFSGGMENLTLELAREQGTVGLMTLGLFDLTPGDSQTNTSATIIPENESTMRSLVYGIFKGEIANLYLKGSPDAPDLLSRLLSELKLCISLDSRSVELVMKNLTIL